jgi:DNA-binding CsgD family transcriptional regulator
MQRLITQREEEAYRLCSSDFNNLSVDEAAAKMGVSHKAVLKLLKSVEHKAPQLPPVLTPRQQAVLLLIEKGLRPTEISTAMGLSESDVSNVIKFLSERKFISVPAKTISYKPSMDNKVIHKF